MFVPPPLQLSLAEIEQEKLLRRERERARQDKEAEDRSSSRVDTPTSFHRAPTDDSEGSKISRKNKLLGKWKQIRVSSPISPPITPESTHADSSFGTDRGEKRYSPVPFGEQPRKAPAPPIPAERPVHPSSWPSPSVFPDVSCARVGPSCPLPPVPPKSPGRLDGQLHLVNPTRSARDGPILAHPSSPTALQRSKAYDAFYALWKDRRTRSQQLATVPATVPATTGATTAATTAATTRWKRSVASMRPSPFTPGGASIASASGPISSLPRAPFGLGIRGGIFGKSDPRRPFGTLASLRVTTLDLDALRVASRRVRAKKEAARSPSLGAEAVPVREVPDAEGGSDVRRPHGVGAQMSPLSTMSVSLAVPNGDVLDSRDGVPSPPTELYCSAASHRRLMERVEKVDSSMSSLGDIFETKVTAHTSPTPHVPLEDDRFQNALDAIPLQSLYEPSPADAGASPPIATQAQPRTGSVVAVTPSSESAAHHRTVYTQGPIRLPEPANIPRRDSVASLEPLQQVVEHEYKRVRDAPEHRRGDDRIVDDLCEWFDAFGFDDLKIAGTDKVRKGSQAVKRCVPPPAEPVARLIDITVAGKVSERTQPEPVPQPPIPPVAVEQTTRAEGIARRPPDRPPRPRRPERGLTGVWTDSLTLSPEKLGMTPRPESRITP